MPFHSDHGSSRGTAAAAVIHVGIVICISDNNKKLCSGLHQAAFHFKIVSSILSQDLF